MGSSESESERASSSGTRIADAIELVAAGLDTLSAEQWAAPSLCEGWTVKDVTAHLCWRVGTPSPRLAGDTIGIMVSGRHLTASASFDELARRIAAEHTTDELRRWLRRVAGEKAAGHGRRNPGELVEVVVHGLDALHPLQLDPQFSRTTSYRVARTSVLTTSPTVRQLLRHRTLVAADAGWQLGRGSPIVADAASIILYLNGRKSIQPPSRSRILAPAPTPGLA